MTIQSSQTHEPAQKNGFAVLSFALGILSSFLFVLFDYLLPSMLGNDQFLGQLTGFWSTLAAILLGPGAFLVYQVAGLVFGIIGLKSNRKMLAVIGIILVVLPWLLNLLVVLRNQA